MSSCSLPKISGSVRERLRLKYEAIGSRSKGIHMALAVQDNPIDRLPGVPDADDIPEPAVPASLTTALAAPPDPADLLQEVLAGLAVFGRVVDATATATSAMNIIRTLVMDLQERGILR